MFFFVFADNALDLSRPVRRAHHGMPADFSADSFDLRQHLRNESPEWFDSFLTPEMLLFAQLDGVDPSIPASARVTYSMRYDADDPSDLGYLQAAWALAKWLCECGATCVHDAHAICWHTAESTLALESERDFDVQHDIKIVFETDTREGVGHVMHTRGLAKVARPDLMLLGLQPVEATAAGALLNAMARRAALGAAFRAGQTVSPKGLKPRRLMPYEPGRLHPQVNLNNDGLVLDVSGWGLVDATNAVSVSP